MARKLPAQTLTDPESSNKKILGEEVETLEKTNGAGSD
jgi:hypothetical protein